MIEYLEIRRLFRQVEVVSHSHGRMVLKVDVTAVRKGAVNPERVETRFKKIEGIEEFRFDPQEHTLAINYDRQRMEPSLLEGLMGASNKEAERDAEAARGDYQIKEIPSSPEEIEAIRYEDPALAEKIELIHQLRLILTLHRLRESGINIDPLKGILRQLHLEEYQDIFSRQGIASFGWGLLNRFLSRALD